METLTSTANRHVKFAASLRDKQARDQTGCFLVEGDKLCGEALAAGLEVTHAFIEQGRGPRHIAEAALAAGAEVFWCDQRVLARIDTSQTPQGAVMVAKKPAPARTLDPGGFYVALENLQNPGNVGSAIRCAEALGFGGAVLIGECADPFSPKSFRGGMGSAMRLPIFTCADADGAAGLIKAAGLRLLCSAVDQNARRVGDERLAPGLCIAVGNEGAGISERLLQLCDGSVTIPMAGGAQSLGAAAAAAVLMWEVWRRRMEG